MVVRTGVNAAKVVLRNPRNIEEFTLTRQAVGSRVAGEFIPGAPTVTTLEGSVQPLSGADRKDLPEGERLFEAKCILFETLDGSVVRPVRKGTAQTDADLVEYKGIQYAVRFVDDMSGYGYIEIHATRIEGQNG